MSNWKSIPSPVPESLIEKTYEADVVVVGLGYSGTAAFRASQEAGAETIGITKEADPAHFVAAGAEVGHINSSVLAARGVPKVDPIVFFNEMMKRSANRSNPDLVMKFAQKSGTNMDWWLDSFSIEDLSGAPVRYWEKSNSKYKEEALRGDASVNDYHFWYGTLWFPYPGGSFGGHPTSSECVLANQDKAVAAGAKAFYGIEACNIELQDGRIVAVIGKDREGKYYRFAARKAVVMATAGFEKNGQMRDELLVETKSLFTDTDAFWSVDQESSGFGIRAGVWAGGRLEMGPIAASGGNFFQMRGLNEAFGMLWLNPEGNRFCNEVFGGSELAGFAGNQMCRGVCYNIFDEHVLDFEQWSPPMHYGFDFSEQEDVEALEELIAYAATHDEGYHVVRNKIKLRNIAPFGRHDEEILPLDYKHQIVYYGRTPEELVQHAGLSGALAENIIQSIHRYNQLASSGRDEDFGKDPKILKPLDGMLFMEGRKPVFGGGSFFVCGGLATDANCNVLNRDYERIPGLYAAGNCCGRRFGLQYTTPIAGLSLGMSIVLGREAGTAAAQCSR